MILSVVGTQLTLVFLKEILLMIYLCLVGTQGMKIVIVYEVCPLEEKGLGHENVKYN